MVRGQCSGSNRGGAKKNMSERISKDISERISEIENNKKYFRR